MPVIRDQANLGLVLPPGTQHAMILNFHFDTTEAGHVRDRTWSWRQPLHSSLSIDKKAIRNAPARIWSLDGTVGPDSKTGGGAEVAVKNLNSVKATAGQVMRRYSSYGARSRDSESGSVSTTQ